jgi:hypothetical protein
MNITREGIEVHPADVEALPARTPDLESRSGSPARDLLAEARAIVADVAPPGRMLKASPERAHLVALFAYYENELAVLRAGYAARGRSLGGLLGGLTARTTEERAPGGDGR